MNEFKPVLLLGPGRGGTTLLYKLLALHPKVAFISNYHVRPLTGPISGPIVSLTRRASSLKRAAWFATDGQAYLPRRRFLKRLVPAPVEGEELYAKCGLTLSEQLTSPNDVTLGRLRRVFHGIQRSQGGDVLLLKRTANNRRIPALLAAFPHCKILVLWRDGRAVTASLLAVNWWLDHKVWWSNNQTPRDMNLDRSGMVELAARNWAMEVEAIHRGLRGVSPSQQFHLRYEDLIAHPDAILTRALAFIGLSPTGEFRHMIQSLAIGPSQERWRIQFSEGEQATVQRIAGKHLMGLGYDCPPSNGAAPQAIELQDHPC
jgi:hypothetical protein